MGVLFGEQSLDEVDRILSTDWEKFSAVVFFVIGFEAKWRAAVEEVFWIDALYGREGRNSDALEPLIDLLAERIWVFPDPAVAYNHLADTLWPSLRLRRKLVVIPSTRAEQQAQKQAKAKVRNKEIMEQIKQSGRGWSAGSRRSDR